MKTSSNQKREALPRVVVQTTDDDGMDFGGYLRIVRRRWLLIVLTVLLAVGATAFVTLRMTKIYRATTIVRIETQAPQVLGREVEAVDEMGTGSFWSNVEYYETQYKIIASRDVTARVVRELRLNEDPDFLEVPREERKYFKPFDVDEAAQVLQGQLTVEPVKDSRLVKIHVDNPSPERAQLLANAIAKSYLDKNLESMLQSTVDAVDWLSKQLDDAQSKLSAAEQQVYDYKKNNDILSVSLEERQNIITAQMTAFATKLSEAKAKRIELQSRKAAIADLLHVKDPMAIPLDAVNTNTLIQQLKQDYGELSREKSELSERYGPKFPKMVELEAKLKRIHRDIEREVQNILKAVDAELAASKKSEAGLKRALEDFRKQAQALSEKSVVHDRLVRDKENNEKVYELLLGRTKEADLSRLLRVNNVHILDPALLPTEPIKPQLKLSLGLALVIGLMLGLGLALLVDLTDRTIKTQEDVEALDLAFLGIVPAISSSSRDAYGGYSGYGKRKRKKRDRPRAEERLDREDFDLFVERHPKSQVAESCRSIRTNLLFMSADKPAKSILITSPSPQEGKTTVTINLAIAMAQAGAKVLLVDTDMRRPRVHRVFKQRPGKGLSTMVLGESTPEESIFSSEVQNLDVLTCGPVPPNPAELVHTERFHKVLAQLSERYDHLIFDSPPVGAVTDAAILSKLVDGTVLILKSLSTTRDAAKHAIHVLRDIDANVLGAVLNNLDLSNRKYGQHYYYYYYKKYGYYYGDTGSQDSSAPEPSAADQEHERPSVRD
jgi:capsular exopolysaccharide synthesis family protein